MLRKVTIRDNKRLGYYMASISSSVTTVFKRTVTKMLLLLWVLFAVNCGGATSSQPALTSINVDVDTSALRLLAGTNKPIRVTGLYSDLSTKDITGDVVWTVDNPDVVKITAAGELRVVGVGQAKVTITDKNTGIKFSFPLVSVQAPEAPSGGGGESNQLEEPLPDASIGSTGTSTSTINTQTSTTTGSTTSAPVPETTTTASTSTSTSTTTTFLPSTTVTTTTTTSNSTATTTTSTASTTTTTAGNNSGATCNVRLQGATSLACEKFTIIAGAKYRLSATVPVSTPLPVYLQLVGDTAAGTVCDTIFGPANGLPSTVQCDFTAPNANSLTAGLESLYAYTGNFPLSLTKLATGDVMFVSENRDDLVVNADYRGTVSHNVAAGGIESTYTLYNPVENAAYRVIYSNYSNVAPIEVTTGSVRACDPKQNSARPGTDPVSGYTGYICDLHASGTIVVRISLDDNKYPDELYLPAMAAGGASYTLRIVPLPAP